MYSDVFAVLQVAVAFVEWEVVEGLAEKVPEIVDGAMARGAGQAFDFIEHQLDGVRSGL